MNIFVLSQNPFDAAQDHCDKHIVKMVLEYGQMLSTAHRLLDGRLHLAVDPDNRLKPKKFWLLGEETVEVNAIEDDEACTIYKWGVKDALCYSVAHANHPCSVWARATDANYHWLNTLFVASLQEYEKRYHKVHTTTRISQFLASAPKNIVRGQQTPFAQAMPEEYKHEDAVEAYRRFYVGAKARFAKWKNSPAPDWFTYRLER